MDDLYMKAATVVAVALAAFSSFPSTAQQQQQLQTQSARPATGQQATRADSQPSAGGGSVAGSHRRTCGQAGFQVCQTGRQCCREDEGRLEVPRRSRHSQGIEAGRPRHKCAGRADGKENSQIAIQFDHAELKGGQNMAIESVIKSLSPAASYGSAAENAVPGSYGTSPQGAPSANCALFPRHEWIEFKHSQ